MDEHFWRSLDLVQKEIPNIFRLNKINDISSFIKLDRKDLENLGIKFNSDIRRIQDKQMEFIDTCTGKRNGPGNGCRTDIRGLENEWKTISTWKNKKQVIQKGKQGSTKKEYSVARMTFSRQKNIQIEKGLIPVKISCKPVLDEVKLSCWNAFNEEDQRTTLPSDVEITITDNTRKKMICKLQNDEQLETVQTIGVLFQEKPVVVKKLRSKSSKCKWTLSSSVSQASAIFYEIKDDDGVLDDETDDDDLLVGVLDKEAGRIAGSEQSLGKPDSTNSKPSDAGHSNITSGSLCDGNAKKEGKPSAATVKQQRMLYGLKQNLTEMPHKFRLVDNEVSFKSIDHHDDKTTIIQESDVHLKEKIGKGNFGTVYRGMWKNMQVAVKEIPLGYGKPDLREVEICRLLKHPNVVLVLGSVITDTDVLIVMNYVKGKDLAKALGFIMVTKDKELLDPLYNGYVLYNIAQGMAYLHEKGVIHQDLKPANILIENATHKAIICDLGVGKLKDQCLTVLTNAGVSNAGTMAYQHVEQLEGKKPTPAVDVYSFGVITGETYSRERAWKGMGASEVKAAITNMQYPHFNVTEKAQKVIRQCFREAGDWPSFTELLPQLMQMCEVDVW